MKDCSIKPDNSNAIINGVEVTSDVLTSRAGLRFFVRYLRGIDVFPLLEGVFDKIRKSRKGQRISEIFKQLFCFFMDGTSRHLIYFDKLKEDEGYGASIETDPSEMLSSHAVKRFFAAIWLPWTFLFRGVLWNLYLWRLLMVKPGLIVLGLDTMVMDNDEAQRRQGVAPTYKKVKGFQPLQMTWGRFMVDAIFRRGDKHSNHSNDVEKMVRRMVGLIRKHYRENVPILIRMDSGFFDQDLFEVFESLKIGYTCGGKLYGAIGEFVANCDKTLWGLHDSKDQAWEYIEFGDRRGSWKRFRRAIFCRPLYEDRQMLLKFARPDTILYTNLGMGAEIDAGLRKAGMENMLTAQGIIETQHGRGSDELVHRALKDFGSEQLPFKRFHQNAAFYYTMITAFSLYEAFKEDVCAPVIGVSSYATTFRRKVIDVAGKIVRHAAKTVLKVTQSTWNNIALHHLWMNAGNPVPIRT